MRSLIDAVVADDRVIRIHGSKTTLERPFSQITPSIRVLAALFGIGAP